MYIPNPSETTLPQMQRDSEATMSNIHIDYLQNRLGITKTDYPFDNRSDYAAVARPQRARDRPLHRRRGDQDPAQMTGTGHRRERLRRPGRHPG